MPKLRNQKSRLIFEELEPRLLFSADGLEIIAAEQVMEQAEDISGHHGLPGATV